MNATTTTTGVVPQRTRALERANEIRLARARLKKQVRAGERSAASVIVDCPEEAATMRLADLLVSQRGWSDARCRKVLARVPIFETKTIGSLTDRQRRLLVERLDRHDAARHDRRREAHVRAPLPASSTGRADVRQGAAGGHPCCRNRASTHHAERGDR